MKATILKNNFSSGELSPLLSTRTDVQQYANGAKQLFNAIPLVEGGVRKRPGTYFRTQINDAVRLVPFVIESKNPFVVVFKAKQLLIYNPRTYAVVATLNSPYTAQQVKDIQYVQYRYDTFITHSEVPVYRLRCSKDFTNWEMAEFSFSHPPLDDDNARYPFRKATPSDKTIGSYITVSLNNIAKWVETTSYLAGDFVASDEKYYQAIQDSLGQKPSNYPEYWANVSEAEADTFKPTDVGQYMGINSGIVKITKFISESQIGGEIVKGFDSVNPAIERSWSITPPAFGSTNGYPRCCTFFKQRLVLANISAAPNKVWFSATGGNANFLETTEDADAFSVVSSSGLANSILFLEATRGVVCLTSGGEYMISSDGTLTPTTVEIKEHTAYGAYPVTRPCRVGNELIFIQRGGQRVRALSYRYEVDGLVSPEISVMSSHIGVDHGGIDEIVYMQEPESLVWCKLGDGTVASVTFNRDQEVIAWARHDFGGTAISLCSVPTQLGSDQAFILVNRNGVICLEEISFNANLDSQRTVAISNDAVSVEGATYLNQYQLLAIKEHGYYTVSANQNNNTLVIPDNEESGNLELGQPFITTVKLFPPEISQAPATSLNSKAKVSRIAFFLHETRGVKFNGNELEINTFNDNPLDTQPLFTGRHLYEGGDFGELYELDLVITLDQSLPFHLQAIAIEISVNDR
ncbi:carbohydrate-binding protein [Acinetobacter sp. HY1485]|uniref:carbohydrate-binding protein n=1 Tax=Acinetobacter sp. HY1485 TaxID=2970918 RepID=UPI0022B961B7|nr:carbohydrate-binding protein [Acinetobacter sp. HY1485]